jgi:hypothetical protein
MLQFGIALTTRVVPYPLEVEGYSWYIMPEGGAYVWDTWHTNLAYNPQHSHDREMTGTLWFK